MERGPSHLRAAPVSLPATRHPTFAELPSEPRGRAQSGIQVSVFQLPRPPQAFAVQTRPMPPFSLTLLWSWRVTLVRPGARGDLSRAGRAGLGGGDTQTPLSFISGDVKGHRAMREIRAPDSTVSWGYIRQRTRGASAPDLLCFLGGGRRGLPFAPGAPHPPPTAWPPEASHFLIVSICKRVL